MTRTRYFTFAAFSITAAVLATLIATSHANADAPVTAEEWDDATRHDLARVCIAECGWRETECVAIAFVLVRRLRVAQVRRPELTLRDMARAYSAAMRPHAPRAWTRSLPHSLVLLAPHYEARWERVLGALDSWAAGNESDPCGGEAMHWGGGMDVARATRGGWRRVSCGKTLNIFYAVR